MAKFNENAPTDQPVDYTNNSQGPRASANTAFGDLFKDAAAIADGGIKEADRQKRVDINEDILSQVEGIQEEFGVSSATDTEVDAESGGTAARPPALSAAYENLDVLQNAYEKGALKESHYWARLNVMVRQLRAKYPGYRQDIDGMVAQVVGAKPANALRSQLFQEWDEASRAKANNPLEKLEANAIQDGTLPPDYFQRQQEGNPYSYPELGTYVANKTRIKAETSARAAELSLKMSENSVDKVDMENGYRADSQAFVNTLLTDASTVFGKNYAEVSGRIRNAQQQLAAGMPVDTVELQSLVGQLGQLKMEAQAALNDQFLKSLDGVPGHSYSTYIDKTTQQDIMAQALAPIDLLMTSLNGTNNPYAIMGSTAAILDAQKSESQRRVLADIPMLSTLGAVTALAGPDATATMLSLNPDISNSLTKALVDYNTMSGATGTGSVVESLERGEKAGMKADYYNELTKTWEGIAKNIDAGTIPLEVIQNQVKFMFGQDATAILSKMDPASRVMWYNKVASPLVTQQMLKLKKQGDEESWNVYQDWVKGAFVNIFAQEMNGLNAANIPGVVFWDKDTSSFKLQAGEGLTPFTRMMSQSAAGAPLQNLNAAIQGIKPILAENGGQLENELSALMEGMGFQGQGVAGAMFEQLQANVEIGDNPNPDAGE